MFNLFSTHVSGKKRKENIRDIDWIEEYWLQNLSTEASTFMN